MTIRHLVFNNLGLKLTALCLAFFVWIMISGKERAYSEKTLEVDVEFLNVSKQIDVRTVNPEKVRVKIKGILKEINRVSPGDVKLRIDLKGTEESTKLNRFAKDYLEFPAGISVESVYPQWIELSIEEFFSKEVPIRVFYTGQLRRDFNLINREMNPAKVRIFGYKSQIEGISLVEAVSPINLSEITESKTIDIPLKKSEDILRFENTDTVSVTIVVEKKNEGR